jgi:hypothetical protein
VYGFGGNARSKDNTRKTKVRDNININLIYIGWDGMDWIHLAQDRDK